MPASSPIHGKVALITGASSGIGRAIAVKFAGLGCRLAITGRDSTTLEATKTLCIEQGLPPESVLTIIADFVKPSDVSRTMEETIQKFKELDILINNAGIVATGQIDEMPLEKYHEIMQVNVHSLVQLTQLAVPYLEKTKGSIINTSSVNGIRPFNNTYAYCMSKSAVEQFCRCIAIDLAPRGIRVNNVNPGVIVTNISRRNGQTAEQYDAFLEWSRSTHALQKVGVVDQVASVVYFLVSGKSELTTGASFLIDGGRHAMVYPQPPE